MGCVQCCAIAILYPPPPVLIPFVFFQNNDDLSCSKRYFVLVFGIKVVRGIHRFECRHNLQCSRCTKRLKNKKESEKSSTCKPRLAVSLSTNFALHNASGKNRKRGPETNLNYLVLKTCCLFVSPFSFQSPPCQKYGMSRMLSRLHFVGRQSHRNHREQLAPSKIVCPSITTKNQNANSPFKP